MTEPKTIRVMVVDDHDMVRHGLVTFAESFDDLEVVGAAASGEEALRLCAQLRPDVVLMDLIMPDMDGVETTRIICERFPEMRVIVLTSFDQDEFREPALTAGASGYLLKNTSIDVLAQTIRAVYTGDFD